jgi:hypothetical protein
LLQCIDGVAQAAVVIFLHSLGVDFLDVFLVQRHLPASPRERVICIRLSRLNNWAALQFQVRNTGMCIHQPAFVQSLVWLQVQLILMQ